MPICAVRLLTVLALACLVPACSSLARTEPCVRRALEATGRDQAFIYVHGFQTSFDQAARRAAQLAYDLDFDLEADFRGVPMLFSWPSRGRSPAPRSLLLLFPLPRRGL